MAKEASKDQIANIVFEHRNHDREESRTSRDVGQEKNRYSLCTRDKVERVKSKGDRRCLDISYSIMGKRQAEMELVSSSAISGRTTFWQSTECRID